MERNEPHRAFTLIELLVVVTIIVILIALLAPALERAITHAQIAVCGANLRTLGSSLTNYATDHRKSYPVRNILTGPVNSLVRLNDGLSVLPVDDRPPLKGYVELNKSLNDPLCENIDAESSPSDAHLEVPYQMWWSSKWANEETFERLYSRLTYTAASSSGPMKYTFNVLASDLDFLNGGGTGTTLSAHPDSDKLYSLRLQNQPEGTGATDARWTYTRWQKRASGFGRGATDLNYVRQDLSVIRVNQVTWDEQLRAGRLVQVPWFRHGAGFPNGYTQLPRD